MGVYLRKDTQVWMVCYKDEHGHRRDKSFGKGDSAKDEATKFCEAWDAWHQAQKNQQMPPPEPVEIIQQPKTAMVIDQSAALPPTVMTQVYCGVTMNQLLEEYLNHSHSNGSHTAHLTSLRSVGKSLLVPILGEDTDIATIDYGKHILPLLDHLRTTPSKLGRPRCAITLNQYGHYLVALFNYAVLRGYLIVSPMRLWKPMREVRRDVELTLEDTKRIMDKALPHVRWAMEVAFNLGVRPGPCELFNLKWEDVDFDKKRVHVYASKTNTHRYVPISDAFLARLKSMKELSQTEYLIDYKGKPVKSIKKAFSKAVKEAGITYRVKMYDLRHNFATFLMNKGADLAAVSKLMGHSRTSTTANRYYESRSDEIVRAAALLPDINFSESGTKAVGE